MTLMLHAGAKAIDYDGLRGLETPPGTPTHVPIPHHLLVDITRNMLQFYGHEIVDEHFGVTEDQNRFFCCLTLKSAYGSYGDMVGLRNSHDKTLPIGLAFGSRVFVCDNTAFIADHVVRRKHSKRARHELPSIISEIVEPLQSQREAQHRKLTLYQNTPLRIEHADHAVIEMYRRGVLGITKIDDVLKAYEDPPHDWGDHTAWRMFNAATFALTGKVAEDPRLTKTLHEVIDAVCKPTT